MIEANSTTKYKLTKQVLEVIERGYPYRATVQNKLHCSERFPYDVLILDFEIVGICQNPVFDIRPIEPIKIVISEGQIPKVFVLRDGFPPVPHLMVSENGKTKLLCYSTVSDEDLMLRMNGRFLVECINNWFIKTARNELHHPDQPLEPFFLGSEGVVVLNSSFMNKNKLFNRFVSQENGVLVQTDDRVKNGDGAKLYTTLWLCLPASADNIIHKVPTTLNELLKMASSVDMQTLLSEQVRAIWSIRQDPKMFSSVFNQSVNALLGCCCIIVLYIPIFDETTNEIEMRDLRIFTLNKPFSSLLEIIGYRYNNNPKVKKLEPIKHSNKADVPIKLLQLHSSFESVFARYLNGFNSDFENPQIVLIGVGALGSQVFNNCLRAGFGKWVLIDNDDIWPHNLARHPLGLASIGKNKAFELVEYAKSVLEDADVTAIADSVFNHDNEELIKAFSEADIILDMSTSIAAERIIALNVEGAARRVSVFLNPSGSFLTMLVEDKDRSVSLDLLEMQTYKILTKNEHYRNYFESAESIAYSASCRSITSRISQDTIALSAAIVSKEIKKLMITKEAQITVWQLKEECIVAQRYLAEYWHEVELAEWLICLNCSLIDEMLLRRVERYPNETGGVLVGHCDFSRNRLYIVDMVFSPEDSIESPNSYIRGCASLPEKMADISKHTHNNLYYVGEWHSHPTSNTEMSNDDKTLLSVITEWSEAECGFGCMIIVGENKACSVHIKTDKNHYLNTSIKIPT